MANKKSVKALRPRTVEFGPVWFPPESEYELVVEFTASGEPGRKSNRRRIVTNRKTGKPMIIKSAGAMSFAREFLAQVPESARQKLGSAEDPLVLWSKIYYRTNRPDVSTELLQDLLEEAGVISNDRWLKTFMVYGAIDSQNPRVEVRIYRLR